MNLLTLSDLRKLAGEHERPCLSLYMPTMRAGEEVRQNSTRFKNLIRQAEDQLTTAGLRSSEAKAFLDPLYDLLNNENYWQYQSDGLAAFVSGDLTRHYRLPLSFKETALVGDSFYLKPMMPLFINNGHFYLLALSQGSVRLYKGTRYSIDEVDIEDAPASLAEALEWDDPETQLQHHTSEGPSTGGEKAAMFHGHGDIKDDQKSNILRFFQRLNAGMEDLLAEDEAPMVLAGVDYLLPIYREANSYRHVVEDGITGNPEKIPVKELHQKGWEIVQPLFEKEQEESAALYHTYRGTERATNELEEIVPAAIYGQVDRLFTVLDEQQWGRFDPETGQVHLHNEPHSESVELLDLAAIYTFINGGRVYAVNRAEMPVESQAAAVLRWPESTS
jgi:hypothetical protein